jgi:serine/threonine protein kinase
LDQDTRVIAGRYRLLGQVGRGGFGAVFRAEQSGLKRHVAVKLLRDPWADPDTRARFEREARLVQRLRHPNTVEILDFGHDDDGSPFIVYELLEGRTLAQTLAAEGAFSPDRALGVARQLLKALAAAHALGIVHRDLKPSNVMLVPYAGERDFVKVLDFGIARSLRPDTQVVTVEGDVIGTPAYMAPEQLRGEPPKPSADVYAVGLMLIEMLTARRVFRGSPIEVARAQVSPEPIPLPVGFEGTLLGDAIAGAVRKHETARHPDAHTMLAALDGGTKPAPAVAPIVSVPPPVPRPEPRRSLWPWVVAVVGAALVIAVATVAVIYWLLAPAPPAARVETPPVSTPVVEAPAIALPISRDAAIRVTDPSRAELTAIVRDMRRVVHERHPSAKLVGLNASDVRDGVVNLLHHGPGHGLTVQAAFEDATTRIEVSAFPTGYAVREGINRQGEEPLPDPKCDSRVASRALGDSAARNAHFVALLFLPRPGGGQKLVWTFRSAANGATLKFVDADTCAPL